MIFYSTYVFHQNFHFDKIAMIRVNNIIIVLFSSKLL